MNEYTSVWCGLRCRGIYFFGNFNLMISGGINNLLDQLFVGFTNTNSADKRFYEAGEPRNYFGSINLGYVF